MRRFGRRAHHDVHARRGPRLQARLLLWFSGAIVLAVLASTAVVSLTADDAADAPTRLVSRHVLGRVARTWDDPAATEAYVAQLRETTGLDVRVRRDPAPFADRRFRPGGILFENGVALVPVVQRGAVVGALEVRGGRPPVPPWRIGAALAVALLVLGVAARRVARHLSRPLEHLARTATRFGDGDLAARAGIERLPRRWVVEEVREVGRSFDGMAERIGRVVRDQRELLAAISHELRSPLARARVALELARERAGEGATRPIDDVERQLVQVDAILGDLLASARAGLADLRRERTSLGPWVREWAANANASANLAVAVTPAAEAVTCELDRALFGRALHNLVTNALAHGHPEDRPLLLLVDRDGDRARLVVRDEGPGFPEDLLPRVFEPFVAGKDGARTPGEGGLGLGLSLVRRIVEAHGGTVRAENRRATDGGPRGERRDEGAELRIDLPCV